MGEDVKRVLEEHLEHRPALSDLVEHNIIKLVNADPKLQQVMLGLIRLKKEAELGQLLAKRRSLQELIDHNVLLDHPETSASLQSTRRRILKHLRETQLNGFLGSRPPLKELLQRDIIHDTMVWTRITPQHGLAPIPRSCHGLAAVEEKIFMTGGFAATHCDLLMFDTVAQEWSKPLVAGVLPAGRFSHSWTAVGSQLVMFGGMSLSGTYLNDLHTLDLDCQQIYRPKSFKKASCQDKMFIWYESNVSGDFPCPRAAHSAVAWNSFLVVFGGNSGQCFLNDLHLFNLDTSKWSRVETKGELPLPRSGHTATIFRDCFMYVFGGMTHDGPSSDFFALDLSTMTWFRPQTFGTPPRPRMGHVAARIVDRYLIIFGGGTIDKVFDDLHIFDTEKCTWRRGSDTGSVPQSRAGHSCCVIDERLFIFGGANAEGEVFNDFSVLDATFFALASAKSECTSPVGRTTVPISMDNTTSIFTHIDASENRINDMITKIRGDIDKRESQQKKAMKQFLSMVSVRVFFPLPHEFLR